MYSTEKDNIRLFLQLNNSTQIIEVNQLPATVGRSPDCQVVLNDQTVAPVQFMISLKDGQVVIEDLAQSLDNPTKINRRTLKKTYVLKKTPVELTVGRVSMTLSRPADKLAKTIQLHPRGLLGLLTMPLIAIGLFLLFIWLLVFDAKLDTIRPFQHNYRDYISWIGMFIVLLGFAVFVHTQRVRFKLFWLSLSVLSLGFIGMNLLEFVVKNLEYAFGIHSGVLLSLLISLLFFIGLWLVTLRAQLHLSWRKGLNHALLVSLPMLIISLFGSLSESDQLDTKSVRANFNGTVEAYNLHMSPTLSVDNFFSSAHQTFSTNNTPVASAPFVEPPEITPPKTQPSTTKREEPTKEAKETIEKPTQKVSTTKVDKTDKPAEPDKELASKEKSRLNLLNQNIARAPRLAIIIDDVATKAHVRKLNELNLKLNYSFLPPTKNHPHSAKIAESIKYPMIHLPMQAIDYKGEEIGTLHVGDSYEKIEQTVASAVKNYPHAKFINNHTGSKFTSDDASMNKLFKAMKKHDVAFLDSLTSPKSVAKRYAKIYDVPFLVRDVFLDDTNSYDAIARQLKLAISLAKKNGQAIVIGHPRRNTINVLNTHRDLLREVNLVMVEQLEIQN